MSADPRERVSCSIGCAWWVLILLTVLIVIWLVAR